MVKASCLVVLYTSHHVRVTIDLGCLNNFLELMGEEDGAGRHHHKVELFRCFRRQRDPRRRPEVEDEVGRDAMAGVRLVENDIQSRVAGPIYQLQALVRVLVHDHWHSGDEHEIAFQLGNSLLLLYA